MNNLWIFGCFLTFVHSQIPIPTRPQGFIYNRNSTESAVEIEVHIDLGCPDSRSAFPVIQSVSDAYQSHQVRVKFILFPLPYHRNSFIASTAVQVAYSTPPSGLTPDAAALALAGKLFDNQIGWSDSVTYNLGQGDIEKKIAGYGKDLGYDLDAFLQQMRSPTFGWNSRVMWKYSCSKGVSGTPWYFINGVAVDASAWDLKEWKSTIDQLLGNKRLLAPAM